MRGRDTKANWISRAGVCLAALIVVLTPASALAGNARELAQGSSSQGLDLTPAIDLVCSLIKLSLLCPEDPSAEPPALAAETPEPAPAAGGDQPAGSLGKAEEVPVPPLVPPVVGPSASINTSGSGMVVPQEPAPAAPPSPSESLAQPPVPAQPVVRQTGSAGPLALAEPSEVDLSPATIALAAGVSFLGLILIGFPAELFNKTLRENYSSLKKLFPWIGKSRASTGVGWQVGALVLSSALAGLIGSFQKVREWNAGDVLIVALSLAVGFLVTNAVWELASAVAGHELGMPPRIFRSYPGALPFVALFVAISTVGGLQPAYVYGHIAGSRTEDSSEVALRSRAMQTAAASMTLLLFSIFCWALRAVVSSPVPNGILAGITIVGLNRLVFALVPATFLDGQAPFRYNRALWASLYIPTVLAFLLLVLLPAINKGGGGPIAASAALFVIFAGVSLALWGYFRRSKQPMVQARA